MSHSTIPLNSSGDLAEDVLETSPALPPTDSSFSRRFIIAKEEVLTSEFDGDGTITLRHPNSLQGALYYLANDCGWGLELFELLKVGRAHPGGSFFFGDSVLEDGSLTLISPVHPLFICIPYLLSGGGKEHRSLEQLLYDEEFPAISHLRKSPKLWRALDVVCNTRVDDGLTLYAHDEARLLAWLASKYEALKSSLLVDEPQESEEAKENMDSFLSRRAFGILCALIPSELHQPLKERLHIVETEESSVEAVSGDVKLARGRKRKNAKDSEKATGSGRKKKIDKDLAVASKGTRALTAFFTQK